MAEGCCGCVLVVFRARADSFAALRIQSWWRRTRTDPMPEGGLAIVATGW
jgi:predicted signal transduction protein with EAL and GGDEF domain